MPAKDDLNRARALIQNKSYEEARLILLGMPDNPKAQEWLARLDTIAPSTLSPEQQAEVARQVQAAMQQRDKRDRQRRRTGCLLRLALMLSLCICQLAIVLPLLTVAGNLLGVEQARWASERLTILNDTPIGNAMNNLSAGVMRTGSQALTPLIESACDAQSPDAESAAMCKTVTQDVLGCMGEGSDMNACVYEMAERLCTEQSGGNAQIRSQCLAQFEQMRSQLDGN